MSTAEIILLVIAVVLTTLIFYVSGGLVSRDWSVTGGYTLRLLLVAVLAVIVIPLATNDAGRFNIGELGLLFAFVLLIIAVRFIMIEELACADDWLAAIVVSLVGVVLIYVVDRVAWELFTIRLPSLF